MDGRVRRGVTLLVAWALMAVGGGTAVAADECPCARPNPRAALAHGERAFVGTVVAKVAHWNANAVPRFTYTIRIERGLNTKATGDVSVSAEVGTPPCEVDWNVGERVGSLLGPVPDGGDKWKFGWEVYGCQVVAPDRLLAAARPLRRPPGRGKPAFLAYGRFGDARLMALGPRGRVLGYGPGPGSVLDVAVCPGAERAVELVWRGTHGIEPFVVVRDLRTLEVVRSAKLWILAASRVHCADRAAKEIYTGFVNSVMCIDTPCKGRPHVVLNAVRGDLVGRSHLFDGGSFAFSGGHAYIGSPNRIAQVRLRTFKARGLIDADMPRGLSPSPDGGRLAFDTSRGPRVIDTVTRRRSSAPARYGAPFTWLGNRRLLISADSDIAGATAGVFDDRLRLRQRLPYRDATGLPLSGALFDVFGGRLVAFDIASGASRTVSVLPDPETRGLVQIDSAVPLRAKRRAPLIEASSSSRPCRKKRRR
jgi:hypothetical protein